jgi:hypothetical protein
MKPDPTTQAARNAEDMRRGAVFAIDIHTQGGKKLVQLMEAKLSERIFTMVQEDPYCQGILDTLRDVGYNIQLASDLNAQLLVKNAMNG